MIWKALGEHEDNHDLNLMPREHEAKKKLEADGKTAVEALEKKIHAKLWDTDIAK